MPDWLCADMKFAARFVCLLVHWILIAGLSVTECSPLPHESMCMVVDPRDVLDSCLPWLSLLPSGRCVRSSQRT